MKNLFLNNGIQLKDEEISKLTEFGNILLEFNGVMNLTTVTESGEMWIKHFLDSALGKDFFPASAKCCEIGSGGGFPSIPLKILRDDLSFTLIESTGKKCEYLKEAVKRLHLGRVNVICGRAEELSKTADLREQFDCVTARAVARLNTLCEYCMPFVRVGGLFIAYKGSDTEEIAEASNAIKTLGGRLKQVVKHTLPGGAGERNIIVIEKVSLTPAKYPRGNGKERKKPL